MGCWFNLEDPQQQARWMMEGGKPVASPGVNYNQERSTSPVNPPAPSGPCPDPLPSASTVDSPLRSEEVSASDSASADVQEEAPLAAAGGPPSSALSGESGQQLPGAADGAVLSYAEFYAQYAAQLAAYSNQRGQHGSPGEGELPQLCDSKRELVQQWLTRPARRQAEATELENTCHLEGQNEYNIWYGRHLTDRHSRTSHLDREAALYRCDPELDSGYTLADTQPGSSEGYFCAFFAKGCCTKGSECRYKHRIPTLEDESTLEWSRDIFGRERHRDHRDDMGGAGSFNHECKTLFVGGLQVDPKEEDGLRALEAFLWKSFGVWGDLVSVRVIPKKLIGFVSYAYRVQAEFAKVAMADQNFGKYGSLLTVKWAHQDGNAKRKNESEEITKKLKTGDEGRCVQPNNEVSRGTEEEVVRQTLESYCSAWQNYWANVYGGGEEQKQTTQVESASSQPYQRNTASVQMPNFLSTFNKLEETQRRQGVLAGGGGGQWPNEQTQDSEESVQRLANVLNRVEGLSTADFLNAALVGAPDS